MIKNIIFDLGGVILNINFKLTSAAFHELGANNFAAFFSQHKQDPIFDQFDKGEITPQVFRHTLKTKLKINPTDDEFDKAWNAMLLDLPSGRLALIRELRKNFKVFLFSNTNEIHLQKFFTQHAHHLFSACFDKAYYSNSFGKRKPDPDAFIALLKDSGLHASETLFVDDALINIEGAKQVGLNTMHFTATNSLADVLTFIGKHQHQKVKPRMR